MSYPPFWLVLRLKVMQESSAMSAMASAMTPRHPAGMLSPSTS